MIDPDMDSFESIRTSFSQAQVLKNELHQKRHEVIGAAIEALNAQSNQAVQGRVPNFQKIHARNAYLAMQLRETDEKMNHMPLESPKDVKKYCKYLERGLKKYASKVDVGDKAQEMKVIATQFKTQVQRVSDDMVRITRREQADRRGVMGRLQSRFTRSFNLSTIEEKLRSPRQTVSDSELLGLGASASSSSAYPSSPGEPSSSSTQASSSSGPPESEDILPGVEIDVSLSPSDMEAIEIVASADFLRQAVEDVRTIEQLSTKEQRLQFREGFLSSNWGLELENIVAVCKQGTSQGLVPYDSKARTRKLSDSEEHARSQLQQLDENLTNSQRAIVSLLHCMKGWMERVQSHPEEDPLKNEVFFSQFNAAIEYAYKCRPDMR